MGSGGCGFGLGAQARVRGKQCAARDGVELVIEPTHRTPQPNPGLAEVVIGRINQATENAPETCVSRPVILEILTNVPPGKRRRRIRYLRGLADVGRRSTIWIGYLRMSPDRGFAASGT